MQKPPKRIEIEDETQDVLPRGLSWKFPFDQRPETRDHHANLVAIGGGVNMPAWTRVIFSSLLFWGTWLYLCSLALFFEGLTYG